MLVFFSFQRVAIHPRNSGSATWTTLLRSGQRLVPSQRTRRGQRPTNLFLPTVPCWTSPLHWTTRASYSRPTRKCRGRLRPGTKVSTARTQLLSQVKKEKTTICINSFCYMHIHYTITILRYVIVNFKANDFPFLTSPLGHVRSHAGRDRH